MKVFISYAREDIEIARKLRADIEKAGIKTWLDKENLLPGQDWKAVIRKEIKESDYFIALLSSKSLSKRGYVQKELKTALDTLGEFPKGEIFIIPVRLDACEPMDEQLQNLHWAEVFPSYQKGLNNIFRALRIKPPTRIPRWIAVVLSLLIAGAMYPLIYSEIYSKLIKIFRTSVDSTEEFVAEPPALPKLREPNVELPERVFEKYNYQTGCVRKIFPA
ncbi:MAG: toll/interleukin-1 receptor domain-containing protein [Desulfobacteraceae bacterium]|nr:toll/interleukin-1 receptor domain-containing protein [Desulfobacteraceae bacterium]